MNKSILGIHHITAICGDPQRNLDFYAGLLGLRLVKLTVNFDDPGTYHLYYGDGVGHPGTILTFFPWPLSPKGRPGISQVTQTSFAIPLSALDYWASRLIKAGVDVSGPITRFGEQVLSFRDPDGMGLELVATPTADEELTHRYGPVPSAHAIRGFHSATLYEEGYRKTADLLTDTLGFRLVGQEENRFRYAISSSGVARIADVLCAPEKVHGRIGVGTVHHIAWRTPDDAAQREWLAEVEGLGYNVSPVIDRKYFHSIYFREPGNILFEIATDPPGFGVDEPFEELGTHLVLPPWLEPSRSEIETILPKLTLPSLEHQEVR
jgi:catechol 2,3-dioxygenase-like lactoylglutathione lyase family enzyme